MLAPNALTTVEKARKELELEDESKDSYVIDAINMASAVIERFCNRKFKRDEYKDLVIESSHEVALSQFPVHRIISVNGNSVDSCLLDGESGILYRRISNRSQIVFEAGYTLPKDETEETSRTLPFDIEMACLGLIKYIYADDEEVSEMEIANSIKSFKLGDLQATISGSDSAIGALPNNVQSLLAPYRKVNL
ncbi:hypothetical protein [Bacillus sp. Hm123]|uniref:hypothetical protein n=1 Tax=Bacillus sp. Hm123 TaxID=3450745 RepID=UPI003F42C759